MFNNFLPENRYRLEPTPLASIDAKNQGLLAAISTVFIVGYGITAILFWDPKQNPFFVLLAIGGILILWYILYQCGFHNYQEFVARYARLTPQQYINGHIVFLGVILALAPLSVWTSYIICLAGAVGVSSLRTIMRTKRRHLLGPAGNFHRPEGLVRRIYNTMLKPGEPFIDWAGMKIPYNEATRYFALFGAISSGKTTLLRLFMQSFVPMVGKRKNHRVLIYDAKRDMVSIIRGMNPEAKLYILNPFDKRAAVWQIDKDICDPASAQNLGVNLSPPKPKTGDPFWAEATQYILEGLSLYYLLSVGKGWDLRDIINGAQSTERIVAILGSRPETKRFLMPLKGEKLTHSVMTTINVWLSQYALIASAWYHKRRDAAEHGTPVEYFSFERWVREDAITILGRDPSNIKAMEAINRLFIEKVSRLIISGRAGDENRVPRTFIVLDEFHTLGYLEGFEEFATNASGFGVSIAIAMQSLGSLQRLYTKEGADAILGQFGRKGFLRLNDEITSTYASALAGEGEIFKLVFEKNEWRETDETERIDILPANQLLSIQPPDKDTKRPIRGFFYGQYGFMGSIASDYISRHMRPKANIKNIEYQNPPLLPPWTYDDIKRLKLDGVIDRSEFETHEREAKAYAPDPEKMKSELDDIYENLDILPSPSDFIPAPSDDADAGYATEPTPAPPSSSESSYEEPGSRVRFHGDRPVSAPEPTKETIGETAAESLSEPASEPASTEKPPTQPSGKLKLSSSLQKIKDQQENT